MWKGQLTKGSFVAIILLLAVGCQLSDRQGDSFGGSQIGPLGKTAAALGRAAQTALDLTNSLRCESTPEKHRLVGDYWLVKSSQDTSGTFCVSGGPWPEWLCEQTTQAMELGWDREHLAIKINVPAKEYLVIDVQSGWNYIVDDRAFAEWSEVEGLEMLKWEEAWMRSELVN